MDLWIVPAWNLKNKEVFLVELVDRPHVLFQIGLKNREVFQIGPIRLF